jgi:hypothetical protein
MTKIPLESVVATDININERSVRAMPHDGECCQRQGKKMKQSDALELVAAGSLARPGAIGRLVRLALGALCRGKPSEEHHCPAAFINKIDEWEQHRFNQPG